MASIFTGATSSTRPGAGSNRKRVLSRQTKLDKLKANLKVQVGNLKDILTNVRDFLLDEKFAKQDAKFVYSGYLATCQTIFTGENPTHAHLALFKVHFADMFESEEVLYSLMDQGVLPC